MSFIIFFFFLIIGISLFLYDSGSIKESFIQSYLILVGLTVLMTEILSLFGMLVFPVVLGVWIAFCVIATGWLVYLVFKEKRNPVADFKDQVFRLKDLSWLDKLILIVIAFILVITLIVAISAPPNNYDSLTYHMARVAHWIQQGSVKYYPTAIERQNYAQPLTEYLIMQEFVLIVK